MKHQIIFFTVVVITIFCLSTCVVQPYSYYIVEGKVIDKITKEPIENIIVSVHKPILPNQKEKQSIIYKTSPIGDDGWSDENGYFWVRDIYSYGILYFYDTRENVLYKDTAILVDFKDVPLSGEPSGSYKGDYVLNIGDVYSPKKSLQVL